MSSDQKPMKEGGNDIRLSVLESLYPKCGGVEIDQAVAAGSVGTVYKARRNSDGRAIALKFFDQEQMGSHAYVDMICREAKLLEDFRHPNVVEFYECGQIDELGLFYIITEWVEGQSLHEIVQSQGRIEIDLAADAMQMLCKGLSAARQRGIHHLEVKPENVMVDKEGIVKILDFGLSGLDYGGNSVSRVLSPYCAPEKQAHNPSLEMDHRADVFALGVIFQELITGQNRTDPAHLPSRLVGAPTAIDEIVERATSKHSELRYMSASSMADDLSPFVLSKSSGNDPRDSSNLDEVEKSEQAPPIAGDLAAASQSKLDAPISAALSSPRSHSIDSEIEGERPRVSNQKKSESKQIKGLSDLKKPKATTTDAASLSKPLFKEKQASPRVESQSSSRATNAPIEQSVPIGAMSAKQSAPAINQPEAQQGAGESVKTLATKEPLESRASIDRKPAQSEKKSPWMMLTALLSLPLLALLFFGLRNKEEQNEQVNQDSSVLESEKSDSPAIAQVADQSPLLQQTDHSKLVDEAIEQKSSTIESDDSGIEINEQNQPTQSQDEMVEVETSDLDAPAISQTQPEVADITSPLPGQEGEDPMTGYNLVEGQATNNEQPAEPSATSALAAQASSEKIDQKWSATLENRGPLNSADYSRLPSLGDIPTFASDWIVKIKVRYSDYVKGPMDGVIISSGNELRGLKIEMIAGSPKLTIANGQGRREVVQLELSERDSQSKEIELSLRHRADGVVEFASSQSTQDMSIRMAEGFTEQNDRIGELVHIGYDPNAKVIKPFNSLISSVEFSGIE